MSRRRASAWATLDESGRIAGLGLVATDAEIVSLVDDLQPVSVAIDSPLFLPRGLTTLDLPETATHLPTGRSCERALKSLGIGCFYTTPRSIIKPMVYRAVALRQMLEQRGHSVSEVFPYASKVRLFGTHKMPPKRRAEGRAWLQEHLTGSIGDLATYPPLSHDALDALVAAYTGLLQSRSEAECVGDAEEGVLWIPRPPAATGVDTARAGLL